MADVLIWCLRTVRASGGKVVHQSAVPADAGEYSSAAHAKLAANCGALLVFSVGMFVSSGMPGAGLSQGHGGEEVSAWLSSRSSPGVNEVTPLSPQALHPGHGLSETVLPRQRLQTSQRVSSASSLVRPLNSDLQLVCFKKIKHRSEPIIDEIVVFGFKCNLFCSLSSPTVEMEEFLMMS